MHNRDHYSVHHLKYSVDIVIHPGSLKGRWDGFISACEENCCALSGDGTPINCHAFQLLVSSKALSFSFSFFFLYGLANLVLIHRRPAWAWTRKPVQIPRPIHMEASQGTKPGREMARRCSVRSGMRPRNCPCSLPPFGSLLQPAECLVTSSSWSVTPELILWLPSGLTAYNGGRPPLH